MTSQHDVITKNNGKNRAYLKQKIVYIIRVRKQHRIIKTCLETKE